MKADNKNITVAVGMSGGVDSSVAAALLMKEGYNVIGITMKTYDYMEVGGSSPNESSCCDLKAVMDAHTVAEKLGFLHYVVNLREEFGAAVINNFIDEYLKGRTPNPCVICNRKIKFGVLLEKAQELGAQYIATGHYARVRFDKYRKRHILSRGKYAEKDQSYALWAVTQEALSKTLFPLGEMTKPEVRALAEQYELINARKHESYEICFVADDNYERFLKERLPDLQGQVSGGDIVQDGNVVGKHNGYPFYTIGQRRNIGAYGQKMYVTEIDNKTNTIKIGTDDELHHRTLIAGQVNWSGLAVLDKNMHVQAKVRYKDRGTDALVSLEENGNIKVMFDQPKRAITPGQSVVLYDGDDVLCGGVIEQVLD
ncbi:MAG: tRNA 2-thiouridine(34) synthase MnmA [Bacteroidota bacterium]|jgi:tRNA-specific 2-thiouridylase